MVIEKFNELFIYDGTVLLNRYTRNPRALKGWAVGSKHHSGYLQVQIDKKLYMVHRVIWEMYHGIKIEPHLEIDHINHVRDDNRIENLRIVTRQDNRRNQTLSSKNSSGVVGVYFMNHRQKWGAQIKISGKVLWLGSYTTKEDAVIARKNAEITHNFHKNHGGI